MKRKSAAVEIVILTDEDEQDEETRHLDFIGSGQTLQLHPYPV